MTTADTLASRLPAPADAASSDTARVPELSYFFPAHNEEANLEPLVEEALASLPALADRFEVIIVDDGSRDRTGEIADRLVATHPELVRAVHHEVNLGYGAAIRSGFRAATLSSGRSTPRAIDLPTGSCSVFGRPMSTAPASCSGARRWPASGWPRAAPSCRPSC